MLQERALQAVEPHPPTPALQRAGGRNSSGQCSSERGVVGREVTARVQLRYLNVRVCFSIVTFQKKYPQSNFWGCLSDPQHESPSLASATSLQALPPAPFEILSTGRLPLASTWPPAPLAPG